MSLVAQVALLKILLAAVPVSKSKSDSLNVLHEMLPPEMPYALCRRCLCACTRADSYCL